MVYKNIKLNVVFRLLIILGLMGMLMYSAIVIERYLRSVYLVVFIILASIEFLWYVDKTNRDLGNFLLALLHNDFTTRFSGNYKGKSQTHLYKSFNAINGKFLQLNAEREVLFLHQQMLVEHVGVGIVSFDSNGKIHLLNDALKRMLQQPHLHLRNITDLGRINPELLNTIQNIEAGNRKLMKINLGNDLLQLSIQATEFTLKGKYFRLISAQDIKGELEERELEAWQKLIRVLTHEIMNSVVPITSLSDTLHLILENQKQSLQSAQGTISEKTLNDVSLGLDAIRNRSKGLLDFTETYKNLTRIPPPNFAKVSALALVKRMQTLLRPRFEEAKVPLLIDVPEEDIFFLADVQLIEQVLINLIKNAIEAVQKQAQPHITLTVHQSLEGKTLINVKDNGVGIFPEVLDKIFIPFFTTKEQGSGIGLSLSRQIMLMHKGSLLCSSVPGEGTLFTMSF